MDSQRADVVQPRRGVSEQAMNGFEKIRALCRQLRISETTAMGSLQLDGSTFISDHCRTIEDIADADVPGAMAFLRSRFGPEQPELI